MAIVRAAVVVVLGAHTALVGSASAQIDAPTQTVSEDSVERYLDSLGLDRLRAVYLEQRLDTLEGEARGLAATRLATLYGRLLESDKDPVFRREIELRSRALLRIVPKEEVDDLRLTIVKARYFQAERESQASLLAETTPQEDQELSREFLSLLPDLLDIAKQAQRNIRKLEGRLGARHSDVDEAAIRAELDTLRSRVSQSRYYLGWSQVELARLTGQSRHADRALEDFGWILGSGGEGEPSVDAVAPGLLGYSHVARAALGCARASALKGDDVNAVRWLDLVVDSEETLSADVEAQLLAHRIVVLSMAKRWADLQIVVDEAHRSESPEGSVADEPKLLSPLEARLLAVATLSAMASSDLRGPVGEAKRELLEAMAQVALSDLIEQDQLGEVLGIVTRFGTLPIGQRGFIVHYVRAMRAVERAETSQRGADEELGSTTSSEEVANRYLEAAALFELAIEADDAERFSSERGDAGVLWGRCLFVAGQFEQAADVFERASEFEGVGPGLAEEATWNMIVALDRGIESGVTSLTARRDEAAEAFLLRFPASKRAAELLVRRAEGGLLPRSEAIEILLAVGEDSPLRRTARLMATGMMFEEYRAARGPARAQYADRFVRTADALREELLGADGDSEQRRERLARQMLDAAFATEPPSLRVADRLISELDHAYENRDERDAQVGELRYRMLELAISKGDQLAIQQRFNDLVRSGGDYLSYAESLLYERAAKIRQKHSGDPNDPADLEAAHDVMVYGQRLLTGLLAAGPEESADAVAANVVLAADAVHRAALNRDPKGDPVARDLAISLAEDLRSKGVAPVEVLRVHARLAASMGDDPSSLESWRLVLSSLEPGSDAWMEARLDSLLVLARIDRVRAAQVLEQFDLFYQETLSEEQAKRRDEIAVLIAAPPAPATPPASSASPTSPRSGDASESTRAPGEGGAG